MCDTSKPKSKFKLALLCTTIPGFAIIAVFAIAVGIFGFHGLFTVTSEGERMYIEDVEGLSYTAIIEKEFFAARLAARNMIIDTEPDNLQTHSQSLAAAQKALDDNIKKLTEAVKRQPQRRAMAKELKKAADTYFQNIFLVVDPAMANRKAEVWRNVTNGVLADAVTAFNKASSGLNDSMTNSAEERAEEIEFMSWRVQMVIILLVFMTVLAAACSIFGIAILAVNK